MTTQSPQSLARLLRTMKTAEAAGVVQRLDRLFAEQTLGAVTKLLLGAGPASRPRRDHDDAVTLFLQVVSARYDHVIERAGADQLFAVEPTVRIALEGVIEARRRAMAAGFMAPIDHSPGVHRPGWW